jgi:ArsR family transcriptional regulator
VVCGIGAPSLFVVRRSSNHDHRTTLRHEMDVEHHPGARDGQPRAVPPTVDEERLAVLAKALGHPARVRILRLLGARATCVTGELAPELGLAASTVSEHLRILREAGLIETESADGRPCYCLSDDGLQSLVAGVGSLRRT